MKKIIIALLLALTSVCAVDEMDIEDIRYADTKPKYQQVFELDLSEGHIWNDQCYEQKVLHLRRWQTLTKAQDLLKTINFVPFHRNFSWDETKTTLLFGRLYKGRLKECLLVDVQYQDNSLLPNFQKQVGWVNPRTKQVINWHIFTSIPNGILSQGSAIEMSWKWVDFSIHGIIGSHARRYEDVGDPMLGVICKRMYQRIRRKGLENSIIRLAITVNDYHSYSFNVVYDTENEKKSGKALLYELKEALINK